MLTLEEQTQARKIYITECLLEAFTFIRKYNSDQKHYHSSTQSSNSRQSTIDKLMSISEDTAFLEAITSMNIDDLTKILEPQTETEIKYYAAVVLANKPIEDKKKADEEEIKNTKEKLNQAYRKASFYSQFFSFDAKTWRKIAESFNTAELVELIRMRFDEAQLQSNTQKGDETLSNEQLSLTYAVILKNDTEINSENIYLARVALAKSIGHTYLENASQIFGILYLNNERKVELDRKIKYLSASEIYRMIKERKPSQCGYQGSQR